MTATKPKVTATPPRDQLFRAINPGPELRASGDGTMPTMVGHFSVFNQWTEISSFYEGNFLERIAPGAFRKTIKENGQNVKVLLNHGQDPQVGDKPLGQITALREDGVGAYYEVSLLDTSYNRDITPALEAGLYGASFRFAVVKEEIDDTGGSSAVNPKGLPMRTITEARLMEFGPVTFPAYQGATAGVRSISDRYVVDGSIVSRELPREDEPDTETPTDDGGALDDGADPGHSNLSRNSDDALPEEAAPTGDTPEEEAANPDMKPDPAVMARRASSKYNLHPRKGEISWRI